MSRAWAALVACAMLGAACGGSLLAGPDTEEATLGALTFDVPAGWRRTDAIGPGTATAVWTPEANARKESVTVIRSERELRDVRTHGTTIEQLLVSAQRGLRDARPSRVTGVTTAHGLAGARIEVSFTPGELNRTYRRVHVVLVDGPALIHVLYTAASPDESAEALQVVLDSLRRAGHGEARS